MNESVEREVVFGISRQDEQQNRPDFSILFQREITFTDGKTYKLKILL